MKLGLDALAFGATPEEAMKFANERHLVGVELDSHTLTQFSADELRALLRRNGEMVICQAGCSLRDAAQLQSALEHAAAGGVRVLALTAPGDADSASFIEVAHAGAAFAREKKVTLALENTLPAALFAEALRALPDLAVSYVCSPGLPLLAEVAPRVVFVRCADGDIDYAAAFDTLLAAGFRGWLSVSSGDHAAINRLIGSVRAAWHQARRRRQPAVVQVSLDLETIDDALATAEKAVRAGVDWIEAGTPLILGEGLHGVRKLREHFPHHPIVADLKTMDGGYLEAEMMAKAGANFVVVMGMAHAATIRAVVRAARDYDIEVMGDVMFAPSKVECAKMMENLGVDYVIVHTGYDERRMILGLSPLDDLEAVVAAVNVPVQAVGGLSIDQAIACPQYGAPLVVIGAPLAINPDAFEAAQDVEDILREIVQRVKAQPVKYPTAAD